VVLMLHQVNPLIVANSRWSAGFTGDISQDDSIAMLQWCAEFFGPLRDKGPWQFTGLTTQYGYIHVCVYVDDADKAFQFKMRWC
jgi:hypothetical protein